MFFNMKKVEIYKKNFFCHHFSYHFLWLLYLRCIDYQFYWQLDSIIIGLQSYTYQSTLNWFVLQYPHIHITPADSLWFCYELYKLYIYRNKLNYCVWFVVYMSFDIEINHQICSEFVLSNCWINSVFNDSSICIQFILYI